MKYKILDWAGNEVFDKEHYLSFDAADEALNAFVEKQISDYDQETKKQDFELAEDDDHIFYVQKDEYQIVEVKQ